MLCFKRAFRSRVPLIPPIVCPRRPRQAISKPLRHLLSARHCLYSSIKLHRTYLYVHLAQCCEAQNSQRTASAGGARALWAFGEAQGWPLKLRLRDEFTALLTVYVQDYVLRAKDFNSKKQRLKALQQKATTKNPDEFYFQMHSSSMKVRPPSRNVAPSSNALLRTEFTEMTLEPPLTWTQCACSSRRTPTMCCPSSPRKQT